jgi:hypothetical protein
MALADSPACDTFLPNIAHLAFSFAAAGSGP